MLKIKLFCAAGISTAMVVRSLREAAEKRGADVQIESGPVSALDHEDKGDIDVALLGPQIAYELDHAREVLEPKGIKVAAIPMTDYGLVRGDAILELALGLTQSA
ncbi:PTS system, cellobiose-specific IIB component [Propionibacterium cyclohexanicum]|uniref:PTS system, cellobiose-specific IIB component n=1 Tax=Propionibacterium cyclohexanicum TaxID=64702 RepID=A0A1H9SG60_9ACTN|nr:PTS sugar transporter subunit IIB [Propionibacterium cyclohexanicum]SER83888.1 PTS system, cellobiose-specific IIB component [Propionibacterium cyclohexanicum]